MRPVVQPSRRTRRNLMQKASYIRAIAVLAIALSGLHVPVLHAQSSSKEYIRLGGRVIAIENQTISITSPASYIAVVGSNFNVPLAASGSTTPYTWSATGLPGWLALSGASLIGTPTSNDIGTPSFTLKVTDSKGLLSTSQQV